MDANNIRSWSQPSCGKLSEVKVATETGLKWCGLSAYHNAVIWSLREMGKRDDRG